MQRRRKSKHILLPHLLKWSPTKNKWVTWCLQKEADLERDTDLIEKTECANCIKYYKKAILREYDTLLNNAK